MSHTIDLEKDQLITISHACRLLPSKPAPSTSWRWRTKGVKVNGRTIKLSCIRTGGKWLTTAAAFASFLREQTEAASARPADGSAERPDDTQRRLTEAGLVLPKAINRDDSQSQLSH